MAPIGAQLDDPGRRQRTISFLLDRTPDVNEIRLIGNISITYQYPIDAFL